LANSVLPWWALIFIGGTTAREEKRETKTLRRKFPLWDVIFGTYYLPPGIVSDEYGIEEALPTTYVDQMFHPFRGVTGKWET
jgi:hypothetical protein